MTKDLAYRIQDAAQRQHLTQISAIKTEQVLGRKSGQGVYGIRVANAAYLFRVMLAVAGEFCDVDGNPLYPVERGLLTHNLPNGEIIIC